MNKIMEKKYKLVDASPEENQKFADAFSALLKSFPDLNVITNIVKKSINVKMDNGQTEIVFFDSPTLLIQKKVEVLETEVVKEEAVISPIQSDDLAKS